MTAFCMHVCVYACLYVCVLVSKQIKEVFLSIARELRWPESKFSNLKDLLTGTLYCPKY